MTRVLLITGPRSLADDPAAEAWARGEIRSALPGVDLVVVGDAREGVDPWAWDEAATPERPVRVYRTRGPHAGCIWIAGEREFERWTTVAPPSNAAEYWEWARWLKSRNAAMVRDIAAMRDAGHDVRVLALLDGRKPAVVKPGEDRPTRGTEHTVGLARAAGLTVTDRVWPRDAAKVATT